MSATLLLVEDDLALARGLVDALEADGWTVVTVTRGDRAEAEIERLAPDLVVLDVALPLRSGLDILRSLRERDRATPVLMLTARSEVADRVLGLELGADDYLGKPFALAELRARIRALLRRVETRSRGSGPDVLELGGITFDFPALAARRPDGEPVDLTVRDVRVMKMLVDARGAAVDRLDMVEELCGMDSTATARTVDNHVVALRRELGESPRRPRWIRTVRGVGYRLTIP